MRDNSLRSSVVTGAAHRNNPLEVGEGVLDLRTVARDHELADALVVPGAPHLEHVQARAISPRISTYCSSRIVSVIVEIWESVIEWLPMNSSEVFVKKPAISSCLA